MHVSERIGNENKRSLTTVSLIFDLKTSTSAEHKIPKSCRRNLSYDLDFAYFWNSSTTPGFRDLFVYCTVQKCSDQKVVEATTRRHKFKWIGKQRSRRCVWGVEMTMLSVIADPINPDKWRWNTILVSSNCPNKTCNLSNADNYLNTAHLGLGPHLPQNCGEIKYFLFTLNILESVNIFEYKAS